MTAAVALALLAALVAVAQTTELRLHFAIEGEVALLETLVSPTTETPLRSASQETGYCDRDSECVLLTHCQELQGLQQSQSGDDIIQQQGLRCGTQGTRAMVCCPTPHHLPTKGKPATPPKKTPTTEEPITSPVTSYTAEEPATPTTTPITTHRSGEALLPRLCGLTSALNHIYLGTTAQLGEYPWSAVLGYRGRGKSDTLVWGCGGSLINDRYVLTAAHCTDRRMTNFMDLAIVRLGEYNLDSDVECVGREPQRTCHPDTHVMDFSPVEIVRHPDFNTRGVYSDDVALVRLDRAVTFSGLIQPVCLPTPGKTFSGVIGDLIPKGIGFEEKEPGPRSGNLRHIHLFMVPLKKCQAIYNSTKGTRDGQVCLAGQENDDICLYHPGAPVTVHLNPHGPPFAQVGITSYSALPCQQGVPALYTDVTHYRDWIVNNLKP